MNRSVNKAMILGRVSSHPVVKELDNEANNATQFSIEVEGYKGKIETFFVIGYDSIGYVISNYVRLDAIIYLEGELYKGTDGKPIIDASFINLESRRDGSISNRVPDDKIAPAIEETDDGWINITNPEDYDFSFFEE